MTLLGDELATAAAALRSLEVDFALVGGLAVSARSEPRFTRDADLAVAVADDAGAEALVFALRSLGYEVLGTVEHETTGRLATARLGRPGAGRSAVVDLLFASSGIEPEITAAAETMDVLPGVTIPVASTGHLIALKLLSTVDARPQDAPDLRSLAEVATDTDWEAAAVAVGLITLRGYARGRDLPAALTALR
ncbi:nucleotidyl transferase AbiEii/AbiGii toxin family protein [Nocardioides sp. L-11A]|uniref:nucleotidyl transferase AbiEii/AbiGii toxin family protein n=1 Tax=Nocardioides sp. L-11A TaxID=3043848 RepID=UPI00249B7CC5|nr:nucleotidyl transferase AbiEii/AbiGii toxin family protein [Nocardioides sp. L-11A]